MSILQSKKALSSNHYLKNLTLLNDYLQPTLNEMNTASIRHREGEFKPICSKLNLTRGEKLLDIGCELVIYAAGEYGAKVVGVTLNRPLNLKLNQLIASMRLQGSVVKFMDYRNLVGVKFDKAVCLNPFATIEWEETVTLFGTVYNLLHPGGLFLVEYITALPSVSSTSDKLLDRLSRRLNLILNHSSRDEFLPFSAVERIASQIGFEIQQVEDVTANYAIQLQRWLTYLQANEGGIVRDTSEANFKVWNIGLSILLEGICSGDIHFYQRLLSKPTNGHDHVALPDSQRCCGPRNPD